MMKNRLQCGGRGDARFLGRMFLAHDQQIDALRIRAQGRCRIAIELSRLSNNTRRLTLLVEVEQKTLTVLVGGLPQRRIAYAFELSGAEGHGFSGANLRRIEHGEPEDFRTGLGREPEGVFGGRFAGLGAIQTDQDTLDHDSSFAKNDDDTAR